MAIYVEQFTTLIISNVWWVIVTMMLISSIVSYWLTQFRLRNKYEQHIQGISTQLTALQESNTEYQVANSALSASLQSLQESSKEKMVMMQQAEQQLSDRFERIANQIFDQKTKQFTNVNQQSMQHVVQPLQAKLDEFKQQISQQSRQEGLERAALKQEIHSLKTLNETINAQALALTEALKGDNKQQGNWGEIVLESILSNCGLTEGQEFIRQAAIRDEQGRLLQPDIVVNLPNNKAVIIDSKVSLTAYERMFKASDDATRASHSKAHLQSIRQHVKGLSQKNYSRAYGIQSLDYVLLFLASEAAFQAAMIEDPNIINEALQLNIMLVSPSNLMIALKTINNIWQTEKRINRSHEIAEQATKLHDKLANYVQEMEKIGKQLNMTQSTYDNAMKKLSTGRGSIVSMGNKLQEMGVKTFKTLPKD